MHLSVFVCTWGCWYSMGREDLSNLKVYCDRESLRHSSTDAPHRDLFFICSRHLLSSPFYSILSCHVSLSCHLSLSTCFIRCFHILSLPFFNAIFPSLLLFPQSTLLPSYIRLYVFHAFLSFFHSFFHL